MLWKPGTGKVFSNPISMFRDPAPTQSFTPSVNQFDPSAQASSCPIQNPELNSQPGVLFYQIASKTYLAAMVSISISAPKGRSFTAYAARAGAFSG